jgi:L-amino acid N-acyltransferase YncA
MAVAIRDATAKDVQAILEIFNHEVETSNVVYLSVVQTLEQRMAWFNDRVREGYPVVVAVKGSEIVGFGSYGQFRMGYKYTVEHSVYVHKSHRGQGISKQIMEWLIHHAREHGYHVMVAVIDSGNDLSVLLHRKYGFEDAGCMKQVGYKFGRWLDVKFMQLTFATPTDPV